MLLVLAIHIVATAVVAALSPRLGPKVLLVAAVAPLSGVALMLANLDTAQHGHIHTESISWVPGLELDIAMRMDPLGWLMLVLVSGVGAAIFVYSAWYMHRGTQLNRLAWALTAFAGAMFGLVLTDDVIMLYVFWELTSVTSFLLIGLDDEQRKARAAARQAMLVTVLGGLAMLVGLIMLATDAGSTRISDIIADPPHGGYAEIAVALLLLGAVTKSAQVPFHIWLPAAMAAPTPVSAYLHAAAMVKAGIYLVARFAPAFAETIAWWRPTLAAFGIATMIVGGWRALRQHDLKTLTAYSTVSQLGFIMTVAAWGTYPAATAFTALLITHGMAKAALFMVVGAVDHATHTRDLRRLDGLYRQMPVTAALAALVAASMAGVPLLVGFIAKEEVLAAINETDGPVATTVLISMILGSALTMAYSLRLWWGAFGPKQLTGNDYDRPTTEATVVPAERIHRPELGLVAPIGVLALSSLLLGVVPGLLDGLGSGMAHPVDAHAHPHYAFWHGVQPELGMSGTAILCGILLFAARPRFAQLQNEFHESKPEYLDAEKGYQASIQFVRWVSFRVTGRTQTGSLPQYLGLTALLCAGVPGILVLALGGDLSGIPLTQSLQQGTVALFITGTAALTVAMRQRLAAALALGAVGCGVALLFVLYGAPDLALTQFLVETLSLVVFLLVLRLLPREFPPLRSQLTQWIRAAIAVFVGVSMGILGLLAGAARVGDTVAQDLVERSYPDAHGRNIVNVILVDFRGFDTYGEITVVLTAAVGIATLVLTLREDKARPEDVINPAASRWQHSTILDRVVRVLFHVVIVVSLYFLMAGHNNPGGGFIGGLVAGGAFVMVYLTGTVDVRTLLPVRAGAVLGGGLVLSSIGVLVPWLFGRQVLESGYFSGETILGKFGISSVVVFDTGVYLIVVGMILTVLITFAARPDAALVGLEQQADEETATTSGVHRRPPSGHRRDAG